VNFQQDRPIYLQIADYITENILTSRWKENDRVPSARDLAVSIEVNPNTVVRTFNYLQEKGIIHNQRGIGYFIAGGARNRTLELERDSFVRERLPRVFKEMDILGFAIDDIREFYDQYRIGSPGSQVEPENRSGTE
jgi:GntR family transcriptional regulator